MNELVNTYYGTFDPTIKPKQGVEYFMLDQCLLNLVNKNAERFSKEIDVLIAAFKKNTLKDIEDSLLELKQDMRRVKNILDIPERKPKKKKKINPVYILSKEEQKEMEEIKHKVEKKLSRGRL